LRPKYGESLFYGLLGGGVATPAIFVLTDALRDGDTKSAETGIDDIIGGWVRDAEKSGELKRLPGYGKPLELDEDEHVPGTSLGGL
jgi:hypothetical protein